ncbi:MAG: methyltransferase [Sphingomonadaceae bacterium]
MAGARDTLQQLVEPLRARLLRLIARPDFQQRAAAHPLLRPFARRRARALFAQVSGFTTSWALAAAEATGLLDRLADGPVDEAVLAARLGLPADGVRTLLEAARAAGLVRALGTDRWALDEAGAALAGNPGARAMIAHHRLLWADLADPLAVLRRPGGGELARLWTYAGDGAAPEAGPAAAYSRLMALTQPLVAHQALAAWDFARHRAILDVGGGEGAFLEAVAAAAPDARLALFDLPEVAARARERLAPLGGRVAVHAGDLRRDPLPGGFDCVTLVRILHDHDDAQAAAIAAAAVRALAPGGTLLVVEPMGGDDADGRAVAGYFLPYLRAMGAGRPRRAHETATMLRAAGLVRVQQWPTPMPLIAGLLAGTKV